jgi:hypothetical protein
MQIVAFWRAHRVLEAGNILNGLKMSLTDLIVESPSAFTMTLAFS